MTPSTAQPETLRLAAITALCTVVAACGAGEPREAAGGSAGALAPVDPVLESTVLEPRVLFQAVSPATPDVVWLAGHGGSWARTPDGGATWVTGTVPGHDRREFRDVHAFDERRAVLMSAGPGEESRIFRTGDGGLSWTEVFVMDHPEGFLDCMDFWDDRRGIAYGDAVDGGLYLLATSDGGGSWSRIDPAGLPPALEGEGGFAASGTCLRAGPGERGWIATGNGSRPRILITGDRGATWQAADLPLAAGTGRGASTVGMRPDGLGFALGGDLGGGDAGPRVSLTADGGLSWSPVGELPFPGAAYGGAWVPDRNPATLFAVGPGGIGWSRDGGMTWSLSDTTSHWAVAFGSAERGWAVGPGGRVTRILLPDGS